MREGGVDTLIIGAADTNAEFRTKRFALDLFSREEVEIGFSDYLFACDWVDELMSPRPTYDGYFPTVSTGLPDIFVRPDWETFRVLPWEPVTALVIGDYYSHAGEEMAISPRRSCAALWSGSGVSALSRWRAVSTSSWSSGPNRTRPARSRLSALEPLAYGPAYGNARSAAEEPVLGHAPADARRGQGPGRGGERRGDARTERDHHPLLGRDYGIPDTPSSTSISSASCLRGRASQRRSSPSTTRWAMARAGTGT